MKTGLRNYDPGEFVTRVKRKAAQQGLTGMDWYTYGATFAAYFNDVPASQFMFGPIHIETKKRAVRQTRKEDNEPVEKTKATEDAGGEQNKEGADKQTDVCVQRMGAMLKKRQKKGDETLLFDALYNPDPEVGFNQTVENLFHLSFLVLLLLIRRLKKERHEWHMKTTNSCCTMICLQAMER